jgi:hypothetical protein
MIDGQGEVPPSGAYYLVQSMIEGRVAKSTRAGYSGKIKQISYWLKHYDNPRFRQYANDTNGIVLPLPCEIFLEFLGTVAQDSDGNFKSPVCTYRVSQCFIAQL